MEIAFEIALGLFAVLLGLVAIGHVFDSPSKHNAYFRCILLVVAGFVLIAYGLSRVIENTFPTSGGAADIEHPSRS